MQMQKAMFYCLGFSQYAVPPAPMVGGMVAQGVLPNPQVCGGGHSSVVCVCNNLISPLQIITANPQMIGKYSASSGSIQRYFLCYAATAAGSQQQFALGTVTQPPQFIAQPTQSVWKTPHPVYLV